jgi:hypothetical protein
VARLYADEDFPLQVVEALRLAGHDVLTAYESGQANQSIPDPDVLAFATDQGRAVLTMNRRDFIRQHLTGAEHAGLIVCTRDPDSMALAERIDAVIQEHSTLTGQLLRINRPNN